VEQICKSVGGSRFRAPAAYAPDPQVVHEAQDIAKETGGNIIVMTDPKEAASGADVVYTDVFASMGQEEEATMRLQAFEGYQVNDDIMNQANDEAIFLHCLPAHRGVEVTADVIDGKQSVIFDQAENRLHAQKALLVTLLG
jgi:ornithine carbamoyltransferase